MFCIRTGMHYVMLHNRANCIFFKFLSLSVLDSVLIPKGKFEFRERPTWWTWIQIGTSLFIVWKRHTSVNCSCLWLQFVFMYVEFVTLHAIVEPHSAGCVRQTGRRYSVMYCEMIYCWCLSGWLVGWLFANYRLGEWGKHNILFTL